MAAGDAQGRGPLPVVMRGRWHDWMAGWCHLCDGAVYHSQLEHELVAKAEMPRSVYEVNFG